MENIVPSLIAGNHEDLLSTVSTLRRGSTVLLLGDVDTGKSTLARRLVDTVPRAALLDLDVGQGTLAPPAAIGAALVVAGKQSTLGMWFIGAVSPVRHMRELSDGAIYLLDMARRRDPDLVVIDTCGLVRGRIGVALKTRLIRALRPDLVVAVARSGELEPILRSIPTRGATTRQSPRKVLDKTTLTPLSGGEGLGERSSVLYTSPVAAVRRKTASYRRRVRAERLAAALDGARPTTFGILPTVDQVRFPQNCGLGGSSGLLIGLIDGNGLCLGIGALVDVAPDASSITVATAVDQRRVRALRLGELLVDGTPAPAPPPPRVDIVVT